MAHRTRNVFVNCPFDDGYKPFFDLIVFTILRCGYEPRCALEVVDAGGTRIDKIETIISECPLGIHDISRTELDKHSNLPRFNMPFELGLYLGAKKFGGPAHARKRCLVLDREPYRYQQFLSDISGQDVSAHLNDENELVRQVRTFLNASNPPQPLPAVRKIFEDHAAFRHILPTICQAIDLDENDLDYTDYVWAIADFLSD